MIAYVMVDGRQVDAAKLLAALYNCTRPSGLGVLMDLNRPMTVDEATKILSDKEKFIFDYLYGRPLKVGAHGPDQTITDQSRVLYDRDAGQGAFDRAVEQACV